MDEIGKQSVVFSVANALRRSVPAGAAVLATLWAMPAALSQDRVVSCVPLTPSLESRFRDVRPLEDFEHGASGWSVLEGSQQVAGRIAIVTSPARTGKQALAVHYRFVGRTPLEYLEVAPGRIVVPSRGFGLAMYVRLNGVRLTPRVRIVDTSGEVHQPNFSLTAPDRDGWRLAVVFFDSPHSSWGGDGNHRIDYPVTVRSLVFDRAAAGWKHEDVLYIDDLRLIAPKPVKRTSFQVRPDPFRLGNLYRPGERIRLHVTARAREFRWEIRDAFGSLAAKGRSASGEATIRFAPSVPGWYGCRLLPVRPDAEAVDPGVEFPFAVLSPVAEQASNSFVGVCTHFSRPQAWPAEGMVLLRSLGIRWIRDELPWGSVEQKRGVLEIPAARAVYLDRAATLGLHVLLILDYANRFYDGGNYPNSPEAIAGFARYSAFLARKLKGKVGAFEVWNEWSGGCGMSGRGGDHGPEAYARLLQATYAAVRHVDPDVPIVGIGGDHSRAHLDRIERMLRAGVGAACTALSVHSYRYPKSPESTDLIGEVRRVADLARKVGTPRPLWITEIGWPTHITARGVDEPTQARMAVRTLALLHASGVVDKVFWYDFKDDGLNREYNEHNFGIVHHQTYNWAPKPAAVAMAVFARLTAGADRPELRRLGDRFEVRYRREDGSELVIAWRPAGVEKVRVRGRSGVRVWNMMGAGVSGSTTLKIGPDPVYILGRDVRLDSH